MKGFIQLVMLVLPCFLVAGCGFHSTSGDTAAVETAQVAVNEKATEEPPAAEPVAAAPQMFEPGEFENPKKCANCHRDIHNEWSKSMHANAWKDVLYQPDYLLAHQETAGATDMLCGPCHAPIAARTGLLPPADGSKFDETSKEGISCDFCHTVSGIEQLYNMGHVSSPGNLKFGPRGDGRSLYHEVKYSDAHRKSEFCGACHMVIHPANGTRIIDTWEDWQSNEYSSLGISCQDCHMTPTPGVGRKIGRSSLMGKQRDDLASHGFIGGSSYLQDLQGNPEQAEMSREFLRAAAELKQAGQVAEDGTLKLTVEVHNVGAGHKIPTGTTYIRIMWLQVEVVDSVGKLVYSSGQVDEKNHVDPNATFFRVLFRDAEGNLTGKSWQAEGIGYDRRIPAKGMDSETYRIPLAGQGEYQVTTRLMYRSFTQETLDEVLARTGVAFPPIESVEMASVQSKVMF